LKLLRQAKGEVFPVVRNGVVNFSDLGDENGVADEVGGAALAIKDW
jgi:hypothetical protein